MNERIIAVTLSQTGSATTGAWVLEFPFPTQLLGVKCAGSNVNTSTLAVSGGATISATQIGDSGNPVFLEPDTQPDYADADVPYTFTLTQTGSRADDPLMIAFFLIGEGGTNLVSVGENLCCVAMMQTGNCVTGAWVAEFPFPTQLVGIKAVGSNNGQTTITVAGGAAVTATEIGDSGDPEWIVPDTQPDYADADAAFTVTLTQGGTPHDDPMIMLFFAVGKGGGANDIGMSERTIVTTLMQTGAAVNGAWVFEFPFPVVYRGSKACGSDDQNTTLEVSGGAVSAAAEIGDDGDPNYLTPTTTPDYVNVDTAVTLTLSQGTQHDDPMIVSVWDVGEG